MSGSGVLYSGVTGNAGSITVATGATLNDSSTVDNAFGNGSNVGTWTVSGTLTNATGTKTNTMASSIILNNGTLTSTSNTSGFGAYFNQSNITITANGASNTISATSIGIFNAANAMTLSTPLATDALSVSSVLGTSSNKTGSLAKSGLGTVTLSGTNIYTGTTTISAGTLSINTIANFGSSSALGAPASGAIILGGAANTGTLRYTGGVVTSNRTIQIGANSATPVVGDTGGATIQNDGSGALTFNATNFNTATNAATGTSPTRTLTLQGSNGGTISGIIQNNQIAAASTAAVALTKAGAGTWILSGANTYTGTTTISAGALQLGNANAVQNSTVSIGVTNGLTFAGSIGTFNLGGLSGASNLLLDDGAAAVTLSVGANNANTTYSGSLSEVSGSALTKVGTGTLTLSGSSTYTGATSISNGTLSLTGGGLTGTAISTSGTGIFNQSAGVISGAVTFTQGSSGTSFLAGSNTYTGVTTISSGSLSINNIANKSSACALGAPTTNANARITMGTGANTGTLIYTGAVVSTDRQIIIGSSGANTGGATIQNDGSGQLTFSNAVFNFPLSGSSANRTLTLQGSNGGIISGVIANNVASTGLVALTKAGNGTWVLAGANTYTGATIISTGTLQLGSGSTTGKISASSAITDNGIFAINRSNAVAQGTDFSGAAITGSGGITQAGSGTTTLTAINTYSGATTISAGILNANSTAALGNSSATNTLILNGGTLQAGGTITSASTRGVTLNTATTSTIDTNADAVSIAGVIGGSGSLTVIGTGTLTLTATNTYSGATTISDATLNANSTAALGNSSATNTLIFEDGGILQAAGAIASASTRGVTLNTTATSTSTIDTNGYNVSIAGVIGGTGSLTKIGDGTLTLSGANSFSPNSTSQVNAGTLLATQFASLPLVANSGWFVNPGATLAVRAGGAGEWTSANLDSLLNISGSGSNNFDVDTFLGIEVTGSNSFTYAHDIAGDQAAKGLIKLGTGTLTLNGANTYTGLTTVSAGALNIGSSGSLNDGADITLSASGTANFANAGQNLGAVSNSNTAVNALNFSATTGTVTLDSLSGVGATRFGSNGIVTNGIAEGTVTSVGNLTADITGGTVTAGGLLTGTISAGTVGAGSLTSTSVTGGTNAITGAAGITTLDGGTTTVGGVATIGTMTSGTANLNGATSAITTLNGGTVNLGASTVLTVSGGSTAGSITGTGGRLVKNTGGTLTLSGTNSYTGLTTVNAGALIIGSGSSLNSGNALTLGAGGTATFANAGQTLGAVSNSNTTANALNFSATSGTVTLASLTGAGATRFGSNGIVTGGIASGSVTSVGNLTANISGGTMTVGGVATIGTMSNGTANLNGSTSAIATLNGGTVNLGASTVLTVSGGSTSGSITGSGGSLIKDTGGTLILTGANSYTGTTTVSNGKLLLNGSNTGGGTVTVALGATLGGTGSTTASVIVDGILSPGASIESLKSGAMTFGTGSSFDYEMNSSVPTGDLMVVNGLLSAPVGGLVKLNLSDSNAGAAAPGTVLSLINYASSLSSGFFSYDGINNLADNATFTLGTNTWRINYGASLGGAGTNFSTDYLGGGSHFITLTAVPEPGSTLALGCLVASGALLRSRRRIRQGVAASPRPNCPLRARCQ